MAEDDFEVIEQFDIPEEYGGNILFNNKHLK